MTNQSTSNCADEMKKRLLAMGESARNASRKLATASPEQKNNWLNAMADALEKETDQILTANSVDMKNGAAKGLAAAMLDRLKLDPKRVKAMADGLRYVMTLPDPVGDLLSTVKRPNGIRIDKVSVPIGVIGFIYESRPNVTVDAAGLCLKAGNAVILRGGSEAINSNQALADCIIRAGVQAGMPEGTVQLVPFTEHSAVSALLKMDEYINLVIPRGGERLIRAVVEQSTIPVIKHYKGVCHLYVDSEADFHMALEILRNGKCQRPGVCNALEKVLIHEKIAADFVPLLSSMFRTEGVKILGDAAYCRLDKGALPATEDDWDAEYLDLMITAKILPSVQAAVEHINRYGSGHSDAIIRKMR
jgi:gamma-glutamyl phosphate reductase